MFLSITMELRISVHESVEHGTLLQPLLRTSPWPPPAVAQVTLPLLRWVGRK